MHSSRDSPWKPTQDVVHSPVVDTPEGTGQESPAEQEEAKGRNLEE